MTLKDKLLTVQKELKAPKGQYNSFSKFKYRSAEDILEAVKPLNANNGLLLTLSDEPLLIGDWHYIKATATITDGTDAHTVTAYAREPIQKKGMDESQITGAASSYARKYALNGLYLIDDTKDADTDEYQKQTKQEPNKPNVASDKQLDLVSRLLRESSDDREVQLQTFNNLLTGLQLPQQMKTWTSQQASAAIKFLQGGNG